MNNTPIQMPNRKLGEALITAGIAFADKEEEQFSPCSNEYTPGFLRDRGFIRGAVSVRQFEEKVIQASEAGVAGSVTFFFHRTKEAEDCIAAWDRTTNLIRQHREREAMTEEEQATLDKIPDLPNHSAQVVAEVLAMHANNMKRMPDIIFANPPICNTLTGDFTQGKSSGGIEKTSTGVPIGETEGEGRVWSTNLNNELRAKMGLHPRIK